MLVDDGQERVKDRILKVRRVNEVTDGADKKAD